jgi:hypothetical protein
MTLQSRIATAAMSREISQIVDCDGTKAELRFDVNNCKGRVPMGLRKNGQGDFSESPLRHTGTSPIDGGGQRIAVSPLLIS